MGIRARAPRSVVAVLLCSAVAIAVVLGAVGVTGMGAPSGRVLPGAQSATPPHEDGSLEADGGDEDASQGAEAGDGGEPDGEEASPGAEDEDSVAEQEAEEREHELEATNGAASIAFRHEQQVDEHGNIPNNALVKAHDHVKKMKAAAAGGPGSGGVPPVSGASAFGSWEWLGPGNIGGRINAILVDPITAGRLWIGSATGGVFRTTDGGASWSHLDDFLSNLAVATLVSPSSDPDTIYAGTGEYTSFNIGGAGDTGNRGAGVFVSTDGGDSWNQMATTVTSDWHYTNRLAVHPTSATTLLAATTTGIWKTTNAGATAWVQALSGHVVFDVDFDPTNGSNAVAGGYAGGAWYSTTGGDSWLAATGLPATGRVELAYAASNPTIVYASANHNSGEVYKSTDGGHSYTIAGAATGMLGNQGDYGNAIWVSPSNPVRLIVGGVDLYQSTDSGQTFTKISSWQTNQNFVRTGTGPDSAHADHHAIVANANYPTDTTVYFGNDGGLAKASVTTVTFNSGWQELNNNLGITQFYGADGNTTSGKIIGGSQDNGTLLYSNGTEDWTLTFGGDGGYSAADHTNTSYLYGEYVYGDVVRSSNGGADADAISGVTILADGSYSCPKAAQYEIADVCGKQANFIAPIALDQSTPQRLLVGGLSLWRTNDARTANTSTTGPTWASIKASVGARISAITIAPTNSDVVYVGHNNGLIYRSTNATATTPTWTRIDLDAMPSRIVLALTVDPANTNNVYATFGGFTADNVWHLASGTWTDITGSGVTGLPDVPTRTLVVDPTASSRLYVGTEVGVFTSADTGATWSAPNGGPANVPVDRLFVMGDQLVAATYGRGLFRTTLLGSGSGNTPPTISDVANQGTTDGVAVGPLAVTIGDAETAAGSLTLAGTSSNQALVPNANVTFGGSGASRTVTVTPVAGQSGQATITLTVADGELTASDTFVLTVGGGGGCTDDAREPNNSRLTAWSISSGQVVAGTACDDDWFSISATAGQTLTATLTFVHADGDLDMSLSDPAGVLVTTSGGSTNQEQIVRSVGQSGTWTVRVYPYGGAADQNSYSLTVTLTTSNAHPTITNRAPAPGATNVRRDQVLTATFSESLNPNTVSTSTFRLRDTTAGASVAASVRWDQATRRMILTPATLLRAGHHFTASITTGVKDLTGLAFAGTSWTFTASKDAIAPKIKSRTPGPNQTNVARSTNIVVTFTEQLRFSTLTFTSLRLRDAVTGAYVTLAASYNSTLHRIVMNPTPTLAAHHRYTVVLSSSIRDTAGNRLAATSWSFTTGN